MLSIDEVIPKYQEKTSPMGQLDQRVATVAELNAPYARRVAADATPIHSRPASPDYSGMLAAIANGDRASETALVRALSTPLTVVLRHRARNAEGVDDLCQDALITVLQAAREGRISDPKALVEYALQTARKLASNAERKRDRRQTYGAEEMIQDAIEPSETIDEVVSGDQLRDCVRTVLESLPNARDRQLLHSYYLNETSSTDLQTQWAMDSAQFGKVLHRARARFGRLWQTLKFDAPPV